MNCNFQKKIIIIKKKIVIIKIKRILDICIYKGQEVSNGVSFLNLSVLNGNMCMRIRLDQPKL